MRETLEVLIQEGRGLDGSPNTHLKVYTVDEEFELSEISLDHPRNSDDDDDDDDELELSSVIFSRFLIAVMPSSSPSSLWLGSLIGERLPDIIQQFFFLLSFYVQIDNNGNTILNTVSGK
jgi:hypothetical protein